ncbi:MAG: hypothetical protein JZD41_02130 [Thermoproteus sp.]|nr:hypothetical protein [Thermoproteus sp.]
MKPAHIGDLLKFGVREKYAPLLMVTYKTAYWLNDNMIYLGDIDLIKRDSVLLISTGKPSFLKLPNTYTYILFGDVKTSNKVNLVRVIGYEFVSVAKRGGRRVMDGLIITLPSFFENLHETSKLISSAINIKYTVIANRFILNGTYYKSLKDDECPFPEPIVIAFTRDNPKIYNIPQTMKDRYNNVFFKFLLTFMPCEKVILTNNYDLTKIL